MAAKRSVRADLERSIALLDTQLWGRLMNPRSGILYDYADLVGTVIEPTDEEIIASRPNAMSYQTPVEDGAFYNSLLLLSLVSRWRAERGHQELERRSRLVAGTLVRLGQVSDVDGFVARNVSDTDHYYPFSSDDQVFPWVIALVEYLGTDIPGRRDREHIESLALQKIQAWQDLGWRIPADPTSLGFYGDLHHHAARIAFCCAAAHRISRDPLWHRRYLSALDSVRPGQERTTLGALGAGEPYGVPGDNDHRFWLSATTQSALRLMHEWDDDAGRREIFHRASSVNSANAVAHARTYRSFSDENGLAFDPDWRFLNELWRPTSTVADARDLALRQVEVRETMSPRIPYEFRSVVEPLYAAWVISTVIDDDVLDANRELLQSLLLHYRWDRIRTSAIVAAGAVYGELLTRRRTFADDELTPARG